jgi:hypothetical protein
MQKGSTEVGTYGLEKLISIAEIGCFLILCLTSEITHFTVLEIVLVHCNVNLCVHWLYIVVFA